MCLGIPGQIVAISDADNMLGIVDVSSVRREIHLACIVDDDHPIESCVGDWVLVHVRFAMSHRRSRGSPDLGLARRIRRHRRRVRGPSMSRDREDALASLYPFLYGSRKEELAEHAALLHSVTKKAAHSIEVKRSFFASSAERVVAAAPAIAEVYRQHGPDVCDG